MRSITSTITCINWLHVRINENDSVIKNYGVNFPKDNVLYGTFKVIDLIAEIIFRQFCCSHLKRLHVCKKPWTEYIQEISGQENTKSEEKYTFSR